MENNNRQQAAATGSPSPFGGLGNLMGGLMEAEEAPEEV